MPALEIKGLRVSFGPIEILRGVDLHVEPGETLGVVGESGCGKSMTGLAVMGLMPPGGRIAGGEIIFGGQDLAKISERRLRELRGSDIAMVFQDPFPAEPLDARSEPIAEAVRLLQHKQKNRNDAFKFWSRCAPPRRKAPAKISAPAQRRTPAA